MGPRPKACPTSHPQRPQMVNLDRGGKGVGAGRNMGCLGGRQPWGQREKEGRRVLSAQQEKGPFIFPNKTVL